MKKILALLLLCSTAMAGDNEVYIDQMGEFSTIYVEQDGSANRLGGVDGPIWYANPSLMYGDGQYIDIRQIGSGNYLRFSVNTKFDANEGAENRTAPTCTEFNCDTTSANNSLIYYSYGYGNLGTVNINADGKEETSGISLYVLEEGDFNETNISITGNRNNVILITKGDVNTFTGNTSKDDNYIFSKISGYLNTTTITQTGTMSWVTMDISGNQNTATITQTGGATLGHWTNLEVSGNLNTHTIAQAGVSADSIVDIKTTGANNTYNITVNATGR